MAYQLDDADSGLNAGLQASQAYLPECRDTDRLGILLAQGFQKLVEDWSVGEDLYAEISQRQYDPEPQRLCFTLASQPRQHISGLDKLHVRS